MNFTFIMNSDCYYFLCYLGFMLLLLEESEVFIWDDVDF